MSYQGVQLIDQGKVAPKLKTLLRMQELIGKYTLDELVYGHRPPTAKRFEPTLDRDAVTALLWQLGNDPDAREAFADFTDSSAGKYVRLTRSYVVAWVERYLLAIREGAHRQAGIDLAKRAANAAQANTDAVAARVKPVDPAQLARAGAQLRTRRDAEAHGMVRSTAVAAAKRRKRKHSTSMQVVTTIAPRRRKRA